jgi:hypothetical protein
VRRRAKLERMHELLNVWLKEVEAAQYVAKWEPEYKRLEARQDALAAEMREVCPAAVAQLTESFSTCRRVRPRVFADQRLSAWRLPASIRRLQSNVVTQIPA